MRNGGARRSAIRLYQPCRSCICSALAARPGSAISRRRWHVLRVRADAGAHAARGGVRRPPAAALAPGRQLVARAFADANFVRAVGADLRRVGAGGARLCARGAARLSSPCARPLGRRRQPPVNRPVAARRPPRFSPRAPPAAHTARHAGSARWARCPRARHRRQRRCGRAGSCGCSAGGALGRRALAGG